MWAAENVADHAAERVAAVGGWVRTEGQPMLARCLAQHIQVAAGLDPRQALLRVNLQHLVEVFGEVEGNGGIGGLARQRGATAAGEDRRAVPPAGRHGVDHVLPAARQDNADRDLPVYSAHARIRKSLGEMTRKLSDTASQ